jgi:hypothetical protein
MIEERGTRSCLPAGVPIVAGHKTHTVSSMMSHRAGTERAQRAKLQWPLSRSRPSFGVPDLHHPSCGVRMPVSVTVAPGVSSVIALKLLPKKKILCYRLQWKVSR